MRNLQQYARAVARLVAGLRATVLHVLKHPQGVVHQIVAFVTVDVNHHAHTTSVMLILGTIQSISHIS